MLKVLAQGRSVYPSFSMILRSLTAPRAGYCFLICTMVLSISADILPGTDFGARLRSDMLWSVWNRSIHLSPVGRLIPYSLHRAALGRSCANARLTNSSRICSTVLSFQAIPKLPFSLVWLEYIKNCKPCPCTMCKLCYCTIHLDPPSTFRYRVCVVYA